MSSFERFSFDGWSWDEPDNVPSSTDHTSGSGETVAPQVFQALERMAQSRRPRQFSEAAWHTLLADLRSFTERWLDLALGCGWLLPDLFGSPPVGQRRIDLTGVTLLLQGRPIVSLDGDRIVISNRTGAPNVFYRQSPGCSVPFDRSRAKPIWDVIAEALP